MNKLYKELASYEEKDAKIFKGRSFEIEEMYENFTNNEYLVCHADSGEGKSSIIEAGLIPVLRNNFYHPIHIVFKKEQFEDNNMDFNRFVCQIISNEENRLKEDPTIQVDTIFPKLFSNDNSNRMAKWEKQLIDSCAWLKLRYTQLIIDNFVFTPVLIFDQFEEVFTNPLSQEWTNKFFGWLQELSTDLCPKQIVNEIEKHITNDEFPEIDTRKHFKAIFSLRSEYIGQLDYWGMQKHYIPLLKNNRYLLRPLTIAGAKEVITQQEGYKGLDNVADDIIEVLRIQQKGKNYVQSSTSDLPCISALFLSVVCSQAYDMSEQERVDFINLLKEEKAKIKEEAIAVIIRKFYTKAIAKCNIRKEDLDIIEDVLVNSEGIRQRVSSQTDALKAIDFSAQYLKRLEDARLIRTISEYNREEKSVELIHDCLCSIIKEKKDKRNNERKVEFERERMKANKLKGQREDAVSSLFLFVFSAFCIWILSSLFQDKLSLLEVLDKNGNEVIEYKDEIMPVIVGITNLTIIPFIIYSVVKKFRITTWLSVYGLISNLVIMAYLLWNYGSNSLLVVLSVVAVGVPAVTLLYSFLFKLVGRTNMKERRQLWSIPIVLFFLTIALYLFYLCVFNTAIGYPEPNNSSWAVIVIPLLVHELIRLWFELPEKRMLFLAFLCGLGLLAYNTWTDDFLLSKYVVWAFVSFIAIIVFVLYRRAGFKRRILATIAEVITVVTTVVLNLGFDVNSIDYNSVSHVYNWREVQVKDDKSRLGIIYACNGDTLLPCVFDSISKDWYACMTIKENRLKRDTADIRGLYRVEKGVATYKTSYYPSSQQYIYKIAKKERIDTTLTDSISVFAARTYFELRNLNIAYLQGGSMYAINAVKSLPKLLDLQLAELNATLLKLEKNKDMIDSELTKNFNRSFAKSFYLCLLTDRLIRKDLVNQFSISQDILPFYFYDSSNFESTSTYTGDIDFGYGSKTYHSETKVSKLRDFDGFGRPVGTNQLDAWYNVAIQQMLVDTSLNNQEHNARMQEKVKELHARMQEKSTKVFERQEKVKNQLARVKSTIKKNNLSREDVSSAVKNLVEADNEDRDVRAEIRALNTDLVGRLDEIDSKKEMDMIFEMLIENVYRTVSFIAKESDTNYKANFINICEWLYRVAFVRMYDNTDTYLQKLDLMYRNSMEPLEKFSSTQKEFERCMKEIREKAERLMRQ